MSEEHSGDTGSPQGGGQSQDIIGIEESRKGIVVMPAGSTDHIDIVNLGGGMPVAHSSSPSQHGSDPSGAAPADAGASPAGQPSADAGE